MTPPGDASAAPRYRLAAEILGRIAPDELGDLPTVWQDYAHRRWTGDHDRDRILGSGLASSRVEWAPLVVTFVVSDVLLGATTDAAKDAPAPAPAASPGQPAPGSAAAAGCRRSNCRRRC